MKLEPELGSYSRWIVHEYFSFRTNGAGAPDRIRDGQTGLVKSVVRNSAGTFTITLNVSRPVPTNRKDALSGGPNDQSVILTNVSLESASATPSATHALGAVYVTNSWVPSTGVLQIITLNGSGGSTTVADPDTGSRIIVERVFSISAVGQDIKG